MARFAIILNGELQRSKEEDQLWNGDAVDERIREVLAKSSKINIDVIKDVEAVVNIQTS